MACDVTVSGPALTTSVTSLGSTMVSTAQLLAFSADDVIVQSPSKPVLVVGGATVNTDGLLLPTQKLSTVCHFV